MAFSAKNIDVPTPITANLISDAHRPKDIKFLSKVSFSLLPKQLPYRPKISEKVNERPSLNLTFPMEVPILILYEDSIFNKNHYFRPLESRTWFDLKVCMHSATCKRPKILLIFYLSTIYSSIIQKISTI